MDIATASFAAAIVALILQITGAFPEHKEVRQAVVLIVIGFAAGSVAATISNTKLTLTPSFDWKQILLFALIGVASFFASLAVFLKSTHQREVAGSAALGSAFIFVIAGFAIALSYAESPKYLTDEELLSVAKGAQKRQSFSRAIDLLEDLKGRRSVSEDFKKKIELEIEDIKKRQMSEME